MGLIPFLLPFLWSLDLKEGHEREEREVRESEKVWESLHNVLPGKRRKGQSNAEGAGDAAELDMT